MYFLVFKYLFKNFLWINTVWPMLSFQRLYINFHRSWCSNVYEKTASRTLQFDPYFPLKDLIVIPISTKSYFFLFKKNCIRDIMVWPILSFQGSYINVQLTLIYFLVLKNLLKNCIRDSTVWPFFFFSRILLSFH